MCIFCKIVEGEIPSKKVFENEYCMAFYDVNPQAPVHILVIPKDHIESMNEVGEENINKVARVIKAIPYVASLIPELKDGYRVISNCGENAGQTVKHLHFHILGGKAMNEKIV